MGKSERFVVKTDDKKTVGQHEVVDTKTGEVLLVTSKPKIAERLARGRNLGPRRARSQNVGGPHDGR